MANDFIKKVFTISFKSKPVIKYTAIGFGVLIILLIGFKIISESSHTFGTVGFYFLYIPLWIISSIAILKLLSLIVKALRIGLVILFILGIFLIFVADRPMEGILALGPVGIVILFLLNIVITTLLISLVPGVLAGIFVGGFIADKVNPVFGLIAGLIVLVGITSAIFDFIWRWVIPFSIGFSISLFVGNVVAAFVSLIFSSYKVSVPNITEFVSDVSRVKLSRLSRGIQIISESFASLWESIKVFWERYPVIFVGAVIFGIVFAAILGSEEEEDNNKKKEKKHNDKIVVQDAEIIEKKKETAVVGEWDVKCPLCRKNVYIQKLPIILDCPHCDQKISFVKDKNGDSVKGNYQY
jgi:hypothetical protein